MTGAGGKYGALSAKVHALYGKRLRAGDFARLAGMKSEAEILDALRQHPGWSRALSRCAPGSWKYVGRVELEAALEEELRLEYRSLAHYVPREDRPLMEFRVRVAERAALLSALRRLKAGKSAGERSTFPRSVLRGKVDHRALEGCASYDQLLAAARESIYYPALLRLRPEPGSPLPDFTTAESRLRTACFAHMFRLIRERYRGETQQTLLRAMGGRADLLNIIHILRLKTYFPHTSPEDYLAILFPFHYRLRPELTRQLCAAPDAKGVFALLKESPYRDCFEGVEVLDVEEYYRRALYAFSRRQVLAAPPSICTAMAYLDLKELELMVLVNVIESVKYGVPCHTALAELVGR